jgi:glucosamine 6-phosphate synthetase-like amidotransferase/phosphosugar isomerase protein
MSEEQGAELIADLAAIPELMSDILEHDASINVIARRYATASDFLYLGRGINYPIALEGALKLKEISYIHAEGYPAGEMKHGPIALIDENLPVVVIAPLGSGYEKIISNLQEVRARQGKVIAIASRGDKGIGELVDDVVQIPTYAPSFSRCSPCSRCRCWPTASPTCAAPTSTSRVTWPSRSRWSSARGGLRGGPRSTLLTTYRR